MHLPQGTHLTILGVHPNIKCAAKKFPGGCFTYSAQNGLTLWWCITRTNPCDFTSQITGWTGFVTSLKTGDPVKQIQAAWSGPFPCDPTHCNGATTGTYELDTMTSGRKLPKQTTGYKDEQAIHGCLNASTCGELTAAGLQIGP